MPDGQASPLLIARGLFRLRRSCEKSGKDWRHCRSKGVWWSHAFPDRGGCRALGCACKPRLFMFTFRTGFAASVADRVQPRSTLMRRIQMPQDSVRRAPPIAAPR